MADVNEPLSLHHAARVAAEDAKVFEALSLAQTPYETFIAIGREVEVADRYSDSLVFPPAETPFWLVIWPECSLGRQ